MHLTSFCPRSKTRQLRYLLLRAAFAHLGSPRSVSSEHAAIRQRAITEEAVTYVSAGQCGEQAVCQEQGELSSICTKPITGLLSCERAGDRPWSAAWVSSPRGERLGDTGRFAARSAESWREIMQLQVN